jgi:dynein heavy chain 2
MYRILTKELEIAHKVIDTVRNDIALIDNASRGNLVLTNDLLGLSSKIIKGETPDGWLDLWNGPEQAITFLQEIVENTIAISKMKSLADQKPGNKEPIKLGNLLNPDIYLNALRQQTSRICKRYFTQ